MRSTRALVWILRAGWLLLAATAGPLIAAGLDGRSGPVVAVGAAGAWAAWGGGLVALLVPATTSLTVVRVLAPAVPVAALVGLLADGEGGAPASWQAALGLGVAVLVALLAFAPTIGQAFAQGSAYGDEARYPLRTPGALLLGPVELTWAATVGLAPLGAMALAARAWIGVVPLVLGIAAAWVGGRRLHRLSRRWLVFVPAGVVLHDHLALTEPVLLRRSTLASVHAATADTDATDCTARALGLALELRLAEPTPVVLAGDLEHRQGRPVVTSALLCTPSQPGVVLAEAQRRGLRTG